MSANQTSEQWTPSNNTEGDAFIGQWCRYCARDKPSSEGKSVDECEDGDLCEILAASFCGAAGEWRQMDSGETCCTAFVHHGQPIPQTDTQTIDMFTGITK